MYSAPFCRNCSSRLVLPTLRQAGQSTPSPLMRKAEEWLEHGSPAQQLEVGHVLHDDGEEMRVEIDVAGRPPLAVARRREVDPEDVVLRVVQEDAAVVVGDRRADVDAVVGARAVVDELDLDVDGALRQLRRLEGAVFRFHVVDDRAGLAADLDPDLAEDVQIHDSTSSFTSASRQSKPLRESRYQGLSANSGASPRRFEGARASGQGRRRRGSGRAVPIPDNSGNSPR